jgi:predicted nucleotidyltransferase
MDKKQAIDIVKSYKQEILTFFPNCKIFLYGSYSKGTATSSSDIDVAVVVADSSVVN